MDVRRAIIAVVEQRRAIHKSELCRQVDRSWGTVGYHLRSLKRVGLIVTERHDGMLWVYPARLKAWERKEAFTLAEERSYEVLSAVEEQPGITITELDSILGMSTKVIRRHLSRLTGIGLLDCEGQRPQRFKLSKVRHR